MPDVSYYAFLATATIAAVYFLFALRRFDFLAVSLIGAAFYFSPLLFGRVLEGLIADPTIPTPIYWIATGYLAALVAASILVTRLPAPSQSKWSLPSIAAPCLALAIVGLIGAVAATRGAIINPDKVFVLKQVGYFYVLFETAASLACIAAVVERRWSLVSAACALLAIDLLLGFRHYTTLTALSVAFVLLVREKEIRLFRKIPTYGAAAVALVTVMLLLHTVRFAIFDGIAAMQGGPRVTRTAEMRGDTLQFMQLQPRAPSGLPKWASVPLQLFQQSEPFGIQGILVETIHRNYTCSASNIFKSLTLIPGLGRLLPSYPPTFYDEYQPVLFPTVTYGLGGNIWAEMLCRFGYPGVVLFGVAMIAALIGMQQLFLRAPSTLAAPIAFSGSIVAFYIYRNDLAFTLVLMRQTLIVVALSIGVAWMQSLLRRCHEVVFARAN
jgi:hypothetical protein